MDEKAPAAWEDNDDSDLQNSFAERTSTLPNHSMPLLGTFPDDEAICRFEFYLKSAIKYIDEDQLEKAIDAIGEALKIPLVPETLQSFAYSQLGFCHQKMYKTRLAIDAFTKALECATISRDVELQCNASNNLSIAFYHNQEFVMAELYTKQSLSLSESLNDVQTKLRCYANLGNINAARGDFKEAVKYHQIQYSLANQINDYYDRTNAICRAAINLESDFNSLKQYDLAQEYRDKQRQPDGSRISLSTRPGDIVGKNSIWVGWMIKHQGDLRGRPRKQSNRKRWCQLTDGLFTYSNDAGSYTRVSKSLRVADIQTIEIVVLTDLDRLLGESRSFRLVTDERSYYFTCESIRERQEWILGFQQSRSIAARFSMIVSSRNTNLPASDYFLGTDTLRSHRRHFSAGEIPLKTFQRKPTTMHRNGVLNPLYISTMSEMKENLEAESDYTTSKFLSLSDDHEEQTVCGRQEPSTHDINQPVQSINIQTQEEKNNNQDSKRSSKSYFQFLLPLQLPDDLYSDTDSVCETMFMENESVNTKTKAGAVAKSRHPTKEFELAAKEAKNAVQDCNKEFGAIQLFSSTIEDIDPCSNQEKNTRTNARKGTSTSCNNKMAHNTSTNDHE
eukprot:gene7903-693_t